jgi:hypothetical protein
LWKNQRKSLWKNQWKNLFPAPHPITQLTGMITGMTAL